MLKRMLCLLFAMMLLPVCYAAAEESDADILTLDELWAWADGYKERAMAAQPLNDPLAEESSTEDGCMFVYEFATLYMDRPEMTEESELQALVVTSEEEEGLRGVRVDDPSVLVLDAYYTENTDLIGNRDAALLYAIDLMPEGVYVGTVRRDGQRIQVIDYAVYEQPATGADGYTEAGVTYTFVDDNVLAIRAYGLNTRVQNEDVAVALEAAHRLAAETSYSKVQTSYIGAELEPFDSEDLIFAGMDFANLTAEDAIAALGAPVEDAWLEDGGSYMRAMQFAGCGMTFLYDGARQNGRVVNMTIDTDVMEGPRSIRVGDTLASVLGRFRNGEGELNGDVEMLYGSEESGVYGRLEYRSDATCSLYYGVVTEDGARVMMYLNFDQIHLQEIILLVSD